jgi:hypothetical protein
MTVVPVSASPSPSVVPVPKHPENTISAPNMKTYRFLLQFMKWARRPEAFMFTLLRK